MFPSYWNSHPMDRKTKADNGAKENLQRYIPMPE